MLAVRFHMRRLEYLCINYLESSINHKNVLVALKNASQLKLFVVKEFCLRFIIKVDAWATSAQNFLKMSKLLNLCNLCKNQSESWKAWAHAFFYKDATYNQIVMSKEFETLDQPLMVEIIRWKRLLIWTLAFFLKKMSLNVAL